MKILVIGSGGREHALCWKLGTSKKCEKLFCAPGNAGIANVAECVDIAANDIDGLVAFAKDNGIGLVVVGPEAPLVAGIADRLQAENIPVFGPSQDAAQLEGSKGFMKDFCARHDIPTARYRRFTDFKTAHDYIERQAIPLVIKADGLAAGKGVIIAESMEDAIAAAREMLDGEIFGEAGASIVVEEFLDGEELSYFALCDGVGDGAGDGEGDGTGDEMDGGETIIPFGSAQDHKRAFDGDLGPNTGGMGAYSPARLMNAELEQKIMDRIIRPTVDGMKKDGMPFTGVLFAGIMVVGGEPRLLEFNVRFGDPECQTLMMRLDTDLVDIMTAGATGRFAAIADDIRWHDDPAVCVVMAAQGYPGGYTKGTVIEGLDDAAAPYGENGMVFHAGTAIGKDGNIIAMGGRVLGITAMAPDIDAAREAAYGIIDRIDWPGGFCRRDIGWRAVTPYRDDGVKSCV